MSALGALAGIFIFALALAAAILLLIFILVPLFRGIGWLLLNGFRGIGWLIGHVFEFVFGTIGDVLRAIGTVLATLILVPMTLGSVVLGRWSAAGHYAGSVQREAKVGMAALYRIVLRRPLKLFMLHGLLEGVEQRVPEVMAAAPGAERPGRRTGAFEGYQIVGSLRGGGSGAKLYVAKPEPKVLARYPGMPDRVVIKSFALSEGSSLPQIVRESRSLECAKQLGLVFEHGMDDRRFYYVMPYRDGEHLGLVTRQLHGEADAAGLGTRQLATVLGYVSDLVATLAGYHHGGLWHKDVKPENVIIEGGRAHLVDLGLVTPLRSAMTLTTHGTEYFRDPEMVRQALRGVKVHQVDGAKFDIFAVGAVLYFMIENTFPPHGALSRFRKRSPDALKWIVRRAMADYSHRYETAGDMLADLRAVAEAPDPFAVRPAALPSLAGGGIDDVSETVIPDFAPPPLPVASAGSVAGQAAAAAGASPSASSAARPGLHVTNWWTGAYQVKNPSVAVAGADGDDAFRRHAAEMRRHATGLRHKVATGAMSARRAAREQVKAARSRARDMRRGAQTRRHQALGERQPSAMLAGLVVLGIMVTAAVVFVFASSRQAPMHVATIAGPRAVVGDWETQLVHFPQPSDRGHPVLLVPTFDDFSDSDVVARIGEIAGEWEDADYDVVINPMLADTRFRGLVEAWRNSDSGETEDDAIEDLLEQYDLYGLVAIDQPYDNHPGLTDELITSSRFRADDRRFEIGAAPIEVRPYVLVNDHPAKHDPAVVHTVERLVRQYETRGWRIVTDDDVEAAVRRVLPASLPGRPSGPVADSLRQRIQGQEIGGVLHVRAGSGHGAASERIEVERIDLPPAELDPTIWEAEVEEAAESSAAPTPFASAA